MADSAWQFDHFKVMTTIADIITEIVGAQLPTIPNSTGQKVFISNYPALSAALPTVALMYQGSRDDDGIIIDKGLIDVQVEDPANPPNLVTITTQYLDKLTNFNISIRAESMPPSGFDDKKNSHRLLREIRKGLLLPKHRKKLKDEAFTVLEFMNNIRSTPDLVATTYHEICTLQLKLSTVDRIIDYDAFSFDTVEYTGNLKETLDDPTPIVITDSVTSITPP